MKKITSILITLVMIVVMCSVTYATEKSDVIVVDETSYNEVDITSPELQELDAFLVSIDDTEKQELLKKYFYYPTSERTAVKAILGLKPIEQAKYLETYTISQLRSLSEAIDNDLPLVLEEQKISAYCQQKELANKIVNSTKGAGSYTYTLHGALTNTSTGAEVVYINSVVNWTVNSSNQVTYLAPSTSTGKISYYKWQGDVYGNQYVSSGVGYVQKYRDFIVSTQDQSDPYWTVYCTGRFGSSSVPLSTTGGYTYTP